ncbi:hypothetical protein R1flu_014502 [Riccia fluitans]|uniref:Uncharacterized protein n=1 Tax=Riccia fluitans TaxID=41844 RepID=A0ABD1YGA3_9MARC
MVVHLLHANVPLQELSYVYGRYYSKRLFHSEQRSSGETLKRALLLSSTPPIGDVLCAQSTSDASAAPDFTSQIMALELVAPLGTLYGANGSGLEPGVPP